MFSVESYHLIHHRVYGDQPWHFGGPRRLTYLHSDQKYYVQLTYSSDMNQISLNITTDLQLKTLSKPSLNIKRKIQISTLTNFD